MEIEKLVKQGENRTLPKEQWIHANNVRAALFYIRNTPNEYEAFCRMRAYVIRFADTPEGAAKFFNQTKTTFWVSQIAKFVRENPEKTLEELDAFITEHKLFTREYVYEFYSNELANSPEARANYIEPDIRKY